MTTLGLRDLGFLSGLTPAGSYDADAQTYITAVETADGQTLETGVKDAINAFVVGCKADGIWSAFEQCGILCGARTQAGSLIPLVKPSGNANPTLNGTAGGWTYNRKTGLAGNGTNNYVDTKYAYPAGNQNNCHAAVRKSTTASGGGNPYWIGTATSGFGTILAIGASALYAASSLITDGASYDVGLHGLTRGSASIFLYKRPAFSVRSSSTSGSALPAANLFLYVINNGGSPGTQWSSAPLTFYSAGKNIDLTLLDSRVTALINALAAAIP